VGDFAELYTLGPIEIGTNVVVSQYAYLCTGSHDYRDRAFGMKIGPIRIEDEAWVAAGAFVHPNVSVGQGAILAARAVLKSDAEACGIYAGDPAKKVSMRR
jgi:putative colanic acid biosynthesis acetyltransferase WcaF